MVSGRTTCAAPDHAVSAPPGSGAPRPPIRRRH